MHLHILGICGTFMGGVALLARAAGHRVSGCDANVYPPMSDQLEAQGITLTEGYSANQVTLAPDIFVVGNAISRGNPLLEAILERDLPYTSGPQWLAENVLRGRWVMAVAGTHGKTTTTAMLTSILEYAGLTPGFLIGGVPQDFGVSARLTDSPFFVIEADEYDTAFFDKRSKFVHYRPRTTVLNNLEFDHADIFADLAAIETQFHHLVRTLPANGLIVANAAESAVRRVLDRACWTPVEWFNSDRGWWAGEAGYRGDFELGLADKTLGSIRLVLPGAHNRSNALAALAAARHAGVPPAVALAGLERFKGVRRRLELRGEVGGVQVLDDFAHHPTAITVTIAGLRADMDGSGRILAVLEPRSNTMKLGVMNRRLPESLAGADVVYCFAHQLGWDVGQVLAPLADKAKVFDQMPALVAAIAAEARSGDRILVMSNGGFGGIHGSLLDALASPDRARRD